MPSYGKFHNLFSFLKKEECCGKLEKLEQDNLKPNKTIFDICLPQSHQDSLGQRIPPTVVIVDAVVGDLLSNLTADAAEDEQQPQPRGS